VRDAAVSKNVHRRVKHVREKVFFLLLALSFDSDLRMRRYHHSAGLRNTTGPKRRRLSAAHHNVGRVIEHFGRGGDNNLENKQAGRFSSGLRRHYRLW
jgi:hypothetical protein